MTKEDLICFVWFTGYVVFLLAADSGDTVSWLICSLLWIALLVQWFAKECELERIRNRLMNYIKHADEDIREVEKRRNPRAEK